MPELSEARSPEDRIRAVAAILAKSLLRLHERPQPCFGKPQSDSASSLEDFDETRLSVRVG